LHQNILWPEGQFLGFDNADDLTIDAEGVVSRAIRSLELFNGAGAIVGERLLR